MLWGETLDLTCIRNCITNHCIIWGPPHGEDSAMQPISRGVPLLLSPSPEFLVPTPQKRQWCVLGWTDPDQLLSLHRYGVRKSCYKEEFMFLTLLSWYTHYDCVIFYNIVIISLDFRHQIWNPSLLHSQSSADLFSFQDWPNGPIGSPLGSIPLRGPDSLQPLQTAQCRLQTTRESHLQLQEPELCSISGAGYLTLQFGYHKCHLSFYTAFNDKAF